MRLSHVFDHEIECARQLQGHRRHLIELGVPAHVVSDFFAEATSALTRAQREALWCHSNLARFHWSQYWPLLSPHAHITHFITETIWASVWSWFVNCGLAMQVMSARRKYNVNWPLLCADPSNDHSDDFNSVQRSYQNMLEVWAPVSILCLVSGLIYPILAVLLLVGPHPTDSSLQRKCSEVSEYFVFDPHGNRFANELER